MFQIRTRSVMLWAVASALVVGCKSTEQHVEYYPDGAKMMEGTLVGGLQEGSWTHYHENGRKKAEGQCEDDHQDGEWTFWYPDGSVEMKGRFDAEVRVGEWSYWSPSGALTARGEFRDGLEHGLWEFANDAGVTLRRGFFDRGRCCYGWSEWYPSGAPKATGFYFAGEKVGPWSFWAEDGSLSTKVYDPPLDASGRAYEIVLEFWEDGELRRQGLAQGGRPVGGWSTWHRSGNPRSAGSFVGGEASGTWAFWAEDGAPLARGSVERGRPSGEWTVWTDGAEASQRMDSSRPPAPFSGEWSLASVAASPEQAVQTWLAEARSGSSPFDPAQLPSSDAPELALEESVAPELGAPAPPSPHSPKELELLVEWVSAYMKSAEKSKARQRGGYDSTDVLFGGGEAGGDAERSDQIVGKTFTGRVQTARGKWVELADGDKNTLLVIFKGLHDGICVYCTAQLSAYLQSQSELEALNTRICYLYPGSRDSVQVFEEMYCQKFGNRQLPCDLLLDTQHTFIDDAGIGGVDLARPTTLILDPTGKVLWAYVGAGDEDRPSVDELKEVLQEKRVVGTN